MRAGGSCFIRIDRLDFIYKWSDIFCGVNSGRRRELLRELPDDWKGEAADEYMSRLNATRDHLARCIEAMYRVAEDAVIEIDNKYTHQKSSG